MGIRMEAGMPLIETGDAPRILVTGVERLEKITPGLFSFVMTREIHLDRQRFRRVELYLDCTSSAVGEGLRLIFRQAPELVAPIVRIKVEKLLGAGH